MNLEGKKIGFAITGPFCGFKKIIEQLQKIVHLGADIIPVMPANTYIDKLKNEKGIIKDIENITNHKILYKTKDIENLDFYSLIDVVVVLPATSNTIAKLSNNIIDNSVTLFVTSNLKYEKPVVVGIASADGLTYGAENIGKLLSKRNYYFVPFRQSNPITKPSSLQFYPEYLIKTVELALSSEQIQPMLI